MSRFRCACNAPASAHRRFASDGIACPTVRALVAASIARAHANVRDGLDFDAGSDPDATLALLGLPARTGAVAEPPLIPVEILRESGPRRSRRRTYHGAA